MAKPHNKTLLGSEGGKTSAHWYDFLLSKRRIMAFGGKWNGPRVKTKPGTKYILYLGEKLPGDQ